MLLLADNKGIMNSGLERKNDLDRYTSESSLLLHLYEKIISGDLKTFNSLKEYVSKLSVTTILRKNLFKAFVLQRKLYWGFFSDLSPKKYPKLWKEIVITDSTFRFAGDLKQFMSIPDIYLGLLDIHGYTKYCHDKKRNISMIDLLDRMIYEDVNAICAESGVISKRAQGDEILLLGASAPDVLKTVLQIMDYFNTQGRSSRSTVLSRKLPGTVLPKFQISAGIAGGQKFTPLVITRDGDISGDIVNTAARLQSKANKISPDKNRIMITNHVYQKFQALVKDDKEPYFSRIDFFSVGTVEFKGVSLAVYDVVFIPEENLRLELREPMMELYRSLDKKMWKTTIFKNALEASTEAIHILLKKGCKDSAAGRALEEKCRAVLELIKSAWKTYYANYYEASIKIFSQAVDELSNIKGIDRITVEYLQLVKHNYQELSNAYIKILDEEVGLRMNELYSMSEKENFLLLEKHQSMFDKIQSSARLKLQNRKKIWHRVTDDFSEELGITLQSFK